MSKFFVSRSQIDKTNNNSNDSDNNNNNNNGEHAEITIVGTDVNHIKNVLRYGIGKHLEICCKEDSKNYICEIIHYSVKQVRLQNSIQCNIVL